MICQRCLKHLGRTRNAVPSSHRAWYSTLVTAQTTTATNPRPDGKPAATTQAGTAQPFSTPLTPKPSREGNLPMQRNQSKAAAKLPVSSVPAGTPLKGLTFEKNKQDPVAKEDAEYPAWLWTALARKEEAAASASGGFNEGDLFAKSKRVRQRAAKALRRQQALNPEALAPKIPMYEQSIDLPGGDGTLQGALEAGEARGELTSSMRDMRRKKIKEQNFLKAMKA
ncbi:hypothetical protein KC332_g12205 [Hortaea werneckii]|uniref:Large ribosomal subunit protein mL54 n=1 Tax=Hortaea werneckii TaxID=91943 RepID=A0A3M7IXB9_HORWE|nr:hypothetical protein KC358_g15415 [Hortaea werneckii]KAI6809923.1 hypothetical protein KC350_g12726 [Hortaea werneckii]KAI6911715.1 hypothetical protein KC348_g12884 [Hortaea werneckii]KAI6926835.1 hypothetical protein KC341_g12537 [Hortaea werneckii]KAI6960761.1 hypothetical protein KC321_g12686 [Hortaea werneckii]